MMVKQNQVLILLVLTVTFIHGVSPTQAPCPGGVATLNTEYTITGVRSKYPGFLWVRPSDGRYVVTCNPVCSPVVGYRATTNTTHSTLTIDGVRVNDAGTWKIVDANVVGAIPVDVCHLTAARSTSSDTVITSSSSRLSSSTTPRSTTVVEGGQAPCPGGVATLNTEYTITGVRSKYSGFLWVRPSDGRYVVTCNPVCSPVVGYRATANTTHSTLTIDGVGVNDAGTWKIVDANVVGAIPVDVCHLTAARSTSSDTVITSSSSRLSSSTTPRSTTVVEGGVSPGAIAGIVISIVIFIVIVQML